MTRRANEIVKPVAVKLIGDEQFETYSHQWFASLSNTQSCSSFMSIPGQAANSHLMRIEEILNTCYVVWQDSYSFAYAGTELLNGVNINCSLEGYLSGAPRRYLKKGSVGTTNCSEINFLVLPLNQPIGFNFYSGDDVSIAWQAQNHSGSTILLTASTVIKIRRMIK